MKPAAEFDATGRRIQKVVTNSGNLDATTVYLYNGQQIIETRDGSSNVVAQFIHGTRYIDELVMARITGKGDFYYHQDANWNVIAVTDLAGNVLERYDYTAYGEVTVHQETSFGDRDGDQDVDSTDKGTPGVDCTGTVAGACRVLDLDFDGDYDSTDATKFDALPQGLARHPGRTVSGVDQLFLHQGLLYDAEIGSYQNRARQYHPALRRFFQRDPLRANSAGGGYGDGMSPYHYVQGNPQGLLDSSGTTVSNIIVNSYSVQISREIVFWGSHRDDWLKAGGEIFNRWQTPASTVGQGPDWDPCLQVNFSDIFYKIWGLRVWQWWPFGWVGCDNASPSDFGDDPNTMGDECAEAAMQFTGADFSQWLRHYYRADINDDGSIASGGGNPVRKQILDHPRGYRGNLRICVSSRDWT